MAQTTPIKIGFLGSSAPTSPHHGSFKKFIPADIDFTFAQETGANSSLYDAKGKVGTLIEQARQLIADNGWNGLIISGGPKEALNPSMWDEVSAALAVPVSLALRSATAALHVVGAKRILLMSPVDDQLKRMYHDYLQGFGIEAFFSAAVLRAHTDAQKLTSANVEAMTRDGLRQFPKVDAIYFQGALLDPLPILEKLENELQLPIVASNPAMLWLVLSKLGLKYNIAGYGKLLQSWPAVPAGPF